MEDYYKGIGSKPEVKLGSRGKNIPWKQGVTTVSDGVDGASKMRT